MSHGPDVAELDAPLSGRIVEGVHHLPIRVHWEDTDAGGIVYHASYLRFMERGRSEMLRVIGLDQNALRETHGMNYVVKSLTIDYRAPGRFDMAVSVRTSLKSLGAASLDLSQTVLEGETILTKATVRCVGIDAKGRPMRAPDYIRAAFAPMLK